jgi:hypothetical protein
VPPAAWQGPDIKNPKPETVRLIGFTAQGNYRTDVALAKKWREQAKIQAELQGTCHANSSSKPVCTPEKRCQHAGYAAN